MVEREPGACPVAGSARSFSAAAAAALALSFAQHAEARVGAMQPTSTVAGLAIVAALLSALLLVVGLWTVRRLSREAEARRAVLSALQTERESWTASSVRRARHFDAMARETRGGLSALSAAIDLLERSGPEPSGRLYLAMLRQSASVLSERLEHVLDYERLDQRRATLRPVRCDVVALIRELAAPQVAVAVDKRLAFALFVPQHPFPWVGVDPLRLRQLVGQLVRNALAHTSQGEVRIELRYRRAVAGGEDGWVSVTVHDTGPGMGPEACERLLAGLEQDTRSGGEIGVGLWIVSRLTRLLGASLSVRSEPGRGSAFCVHLPVRFFECDASRGGLLEDLNAGYGRPETPPGGAHRGRLLLVDDDRVVRFTIEHRLRELGFEVDCAGDAEEAIAMWLRSPTERVLTDLGLPGLDGVALVAAIRDAEKVRRLRPARIVVLTGEPGHGDRARKAGADVVLVKPMSGDDVARALDPAPAPAAASRGAERASAALLAPDSARYAGSRTAPG
jgi:two-component system, NarL family, sensor histidine kinase EvgS